MLQSVTTPTTTTVLSTAHSHEAAGHRQLRSLSKVGKDASCRVRQTSLQRSLRLLSLDTKNKTSLLTSPYMYNQTAQFYIF